MAKLIDCITFFDNNYIFDFRYNVIKNHVDKFIVCESLFDHKNNPKKINFDVRSQEQVYVDLKSKNESIKPGFLYAKHFNDLKIFNALIILWLNRMF